MKTLEARALQPRHDSTVYRMPPEPPPPSILPVSYEVGKAILLSSIFLMRKLHRWASTPSPLLPSSPCLFCLHLLPMRISLPLEYSTDFGEEGIPCPQEWESPQPSYPFLVASEFIPGAWGFPAGGLCLKEGYHVLPSCTFVAGGDLHSKQRITINCVKAAKGIYGCFLRLYMDINPH